MGPPPDADQMYSIMNTPGFQSTMNEMLQNPQMLEYIINSNPALRSIPGAREMMQSPEFRQMMTNPDMIRQASAMQRAFGGRGGAGAPPAFPEPGRTDTTPVPPSSNPQSPQPAVNPFGANPAAGNPFSALLGMPGMVPRGWPGFGNPADPAQGTPTNPPAAGTAPIPNQPPSAVNIPGHNPLQTNPEVDWNRIGQALRQAYGAGGLPIVPPGAGGVPPPNPFSMFGMPPLGTQAPPAPVDTRPPEERYAEQLRQLNDMGFYDFDRNIEALRRTGGSVQGAIQHLLGD